MFKKLVFTFILSLTTLFAMPQEQIKDIMSKHINKVIDILKSEQLTKTQKGEKIIDIMDSSFDYKIMSMLSLGQEWKNISNEQKQLFIQTFEKKLKDSYVEKLELYTNQKIHIKELKKVKSRLVLETELIGETETYKIDYKFYKNKKINEWFIYDVSITGVSIIQTYRKQFAQFLKDKSINDLIEVLKTKNKA